MNDLPSFEGFWWTPDDPNTRHAGRLMAKDGDAHLFLTIDDAELKHFIHNDSKEYEIIHGRTSDGKSISLINSFDLSSSYSSGIESRSILANYVLVGGHVPKNLENIGQFKSLHLKWPSLKRWFFNNNLTVEHDKENYRAFDIKYRPQATISFTYKDGISIEFNFSTDSIPSGGPLSDGVNFKEMVWVSVQPATPQNLDFFLDTLEELKHFFSLCVLEYTQPDEISLVGNFDEDVRDDGTEVHPHLRVHLNALHKARSDQKPHPIEILIPFQTIKDNFSVVMEGWHNLAEKVRPVRSLLFSALYGENRYIESTFLSLAQAVEVFHRRNYGGTYLPDKEYHANVLPHLKSAIPHTLPSDIKQVYQQRFEFFNEYSLAKRLKMMVCNHKAVFDKYVPNWKDTVRGIVEARNYFTHYSGGVKDKRPNINRLVDFKRFIRVLLELEMLANTGIDKADLHNRALSCAKYGWTFQAFGRTRTK